MVNSKYKEYFSMFMRLNTFSKLLTAFVLVVAMSCSDEIPEPTGSNTKQENENDGGNGNSGSGGNGGSGNGGGSNSSTSWIVDTEFVVNGGVGKDGIPALLNPTMIGPNDDGLEYLQDDERVIGVKIGEDVQAFPHPILDYHEIINTEVGGDEIAISYCPLTGTSKAWSRAVNGVSTTFGVSGLLYQSNLILYDRLTQSNWSQILDLSVNGETVGVESDQYEVFETSWGTWKNMYPNTKVTSSDTKWDRDYNKYPYLDYDEEDWLMFPISTDDDRLFRKERVLSVMIDGLARVYTFKEFVRGGVINDEFRNTEFNYRW